MAAPHLDVPALYAALDAARRSQKLSWRELAAAAGVSPSTLSRMAIGKRPDVDSYAKLVTWLGVPAQDFIRPTPENEPEMLAVLSSHLRARRDLSPESAAALEEIVRAAYDNLRDRSEESS